MLIRKKIFKKIILSFAGIFLLLPLTFSSAFATMPSTLKIEGEIASGKTGVEVATQVFAEGKSAEDIVIGEDMSDVVIWQGQTTTTDGGYFCFEFDVQGSGSCTANIYSEDGDFKTQTLTYTNDIDIEADIISEKTGHIYFSTQTQEFKLNVNNKSNATNILSVQKTLLYEGKELISDEEEIVLDGSTKQVFTISTQGEKFGFYTLKTEIYSGDSCILKLEPIRFSVANIPDENTDNDKLGTNMSLREWQTTEEEFFKGLELVDKVGFGFIRASVDLQNYNSKRLDGETGLGVGGKGISWHKAAFEELDERGLGITLMFSRNDTDGPQNSNYNEIFNPYAASIVNDPLVTAVTNEFTMLNEPDLDNPTMSKPYDTEQYVAFSKSLYEDVKAENEDAFIWGPVAAGVMNRTWLTSFLEKGGGKYIDGLDIHGYTLKESPEEGGLVNHIKKIHTLMEKNGISDKPIFRSEYGWTSVGESGYTDEYEQAYYNIRMLFLHDAYNLCDKAASYELVDGGEENEQENRFGMLKWMGNDIPLEAKPLYLAYANYNKLMTDATFVERVELSPDVSVYRYILADGRDCAVTWSICGKADVALDINDGNNNLTEIQLIDSYGNEETIHSNDGDFMLTLTEEPMYLIGDFNSIATGNNLVITDKNKEFMLPGGQVTITLTKNFSDTATIELDLPDNLTLIENNGFSGNSATIVLRAADKTDKYENAAIYIKQDGKALYEFEFIADFSGEGVTVTKNGRVIEDLKNVAANDTLTFDIENRDTDEDVFIYLAGYQDNMFKIADTQVVPAEEFSMDGASFEAKVPYGVDKFKIFIWDRNYCPLTDNFTIGD